MKDFRTIVRTTTGNTRIGLGTTVLTTGSCFSDAIGNRLSTSKIETLVNPFGTAYNPVSIHKTLSYAIQNEIIPDTLFLQSEDIHLNYDFHSTYAAIRLEDLKKSLQERIAGTHSFLKRASVLVITYGTSWVYHLKQTGDIVANCHKQHAGLFEKSLLSQKHIIESFTAFYQQLKVLNPDIRILLTVSPVRHIKDTLPLNSVSKSVLRLSCHTLSDQYSDVEYFPAFEIMMDDLRDYRFYKSDMIHPTTDAEDYIWENFLTQYADNTFQDFVRKWKSIQSALAHKAFYPESNGHQIFLRETLKKLDELSSLVDVNKEKAQLQSQLK